MNKYWESKNQHITHYNLGDEEKYLKKNLKQKYLYQKLRMILNKHRNIVPQETRKEQRSKLEGSK